MDGQLKRISPQLYKEAVTHSSTGEELHNERLEFLGDAVLDMIISEWLYLHKDSLSEGRMSQIRAAVVREESLALAAEGLDLGSKVRISKGEEKSGGRQRPSLLADTLEAVIAAMYLTAGLEETRNFVLSLFAEPLQRACADNFVCDYKSEFQEKMQAAGVESIDYSVTRDAGPDHNKTFWVELTVDGKVLASGSGKTKKQAEQEAARKALCNRLSD
ncbi:MAG: ribonuclease III [Eubacteriales bacterium]|jgi:ribonuclease-3|nr:ribonuclease III [Eubacteriales bacterium]